MPALRSVHKVAIVEALAVFQTPTEVRGSLRERFAIDVSLRQVVYYDPTSKNPDLAKEWAELHATIRERFLKNIGEIPIANQAVRLRALNHVVAKASAAENYPLVCQALEQAAKELGGIFTNRRDVTSDNSPLGITFKIEKTQSHVGINAGD